MQQNTLIVRQLGSQPYQRVDLAMHNFTNSRNEQTSDEVWLVQHPPVYTQGQAGKAEHLLCSTNIPIVQSDRGGQITYHGPGQQILYTMVDLRRKKITVRQFVSFLEQSVINSLKQLHINAHVMEKAPGVYVDNKKICSLGLRIRQGCTFHGLALNVAMNLAPFDNINPCGYAGLKMTNVKAYVADITLDKMQKILLENFIYLLNYPRVEFNNWSAQDYD